MINEKDLAKEGIFLILECVREIQLQREMGLLICCPLTSCMHLSFQKATLDGEQGRHLASLKNNAFFHSK